LLTDKFILLILWLNLLLSILMLSSIFRLAGIMYDWFLVLKSTSWIADIDKTFLILDEFFTRSLLYNFFAWLLYSVLGIIQPFVQFSELTFRKLTLFVIFDCFLDLDSSLFEILNVVLLMLPKCFRNLISLLINRAPTRSPSCSFARFFSSIESLIRIVF